MAWQDLFPLPGARIDAEEERELRLVAQARGGADWALSALVARYQPTVSRYLSRLTGSVEQSRMLAERIFRRMDQRIRGPQGGKQLRLWLLRTSTELGLDALREPRSRSLRALTGPRGPAALLPGKTMTGPLRARLGGLGEMTTKTSRQALKLIWSSADEHTDDMNGAGAAHAMNLRESDASDEPFPDLDPREALRFKMIRAVLAELPYGDAQCLALHLIAGLNQAEVALALGITGSAARKRVVHGLQLFATRYEAAAASLRLPPETAQERDSRIFDSPLAPSDFMEPPARLSNGSAPHGSSTTSPAPPLATEPPRVVPANAGELIEDEVVAGLDGTIAAYDLADEATVVIDPIVVEADSTLPVPAPELADANSSPEAQSWFAYELVAVAEPHLAVGSIPLNDVPLTLEFVDELVDAPPAPVMSELTAHAPEPLSTAREDESEPGADISTTTVVAAEDTTSDTQPEDDEGDELVLVDLQAMTRTPLSTPASELASDATRDEPSAGDIPVDASEDLSAGEDTLNPDDFISIADARAPEVVALAGSDRSTEQTHNLAQGAGVAPTDDASTLDGASVTETVTPTDAATSDGAIARPSRRVPVLTPLLATSEPVSESASSSSPMAPRRVPVLTADVTRPPEPTRTATMAKRTRAERVSHR